MKSGLRRRFWPEAGMGVITALMSLVTLMQRDWIEALFKIDPDAGNGSVEWLMVGALLMVTLTLFSLAGYEWHKASAAISA